MRRLVATGLLATVAAAAATTSAAALARATGVDLEVGDAAIPLSGVAVVTGALSLVGVVLATSLRRWSARPAGRFVGTTVTLTALSLFPPLLADADGATRTVLVELHLLAAAVVVPAVARCLASRSTSVDGPGRPERGDRSLSAL